MAGGKRLRTHVHVHQDDGTVNVYGPDDMDIPAEDAAKIGDHCFLEDGETPVVDQPTGTLVDTVDNDAAPAAKKSTSRRKS